MTQKNFSNKVDIFMIFLYKKFRNPYMKDIMYFLGLVLDYDGTIACDGIVSDETIEALRKIKASGRKLILATGRLLDELKMIFHQLDLFDCIVAENGAIIYNPQTEIQRLLAEPPPKEFIEKLKVSGIEPLKVGEVIVATLVPNETTILKVIRDMGLELEIIFNKGAVMVLPSGINKASGLNVALEELGFSIHNLIGIGDGQNDHTFLGIIGLGVAVANACNSLKESVKLVTKDAFGQGVEELINRLLKGEEDLVILCRHKILIGFDSENMPTYINPIDRVLIAGNSGIGKSTLATALTEKMVDKKFQFCIFDPEGDYEKLENAIEVGDVKSIPSLNQVVSLLNIPTLNVVVNTLGLKLDERPPFFDQLAPQLVSFKASTGRPHWLIIDEAHHLIPAFRKGLSTWMPKEGSILITVHPDEILEDVLKALNVVIVLGPQAAEILKKVSEIVGEPLPQVLFKSPADNEVLFWQRTPVNIIKILKAEIPKQQHKRHTRKYATGDLSDEFCFYFRGSKNLLNLKVQNLMIFLQIAEGVDDDTWMYHLKKNDYSNWFKVHIKDNILADAASQIECDRSLSPNQSREAISNLVRKLYTSPASKN